MEEYDPCTKSTTTKILNIFRDQGISSKNLPQIVTNGRILHPGACTRQSPKGRCDHPSCGTPILIVHPVGDPVSTKSIPFTSDDAIRCCRDSLCALRSAKSANVQHGDICPENIITTNGFYILVSWGRAVLDDKDTCPAVNLSFLQLMRYSMGSFVLLQMPRACMSGGQRWGREGDTQHLGEVSSFDEGLLDYEDGICDNADRVFEAINAARVAFKGDYTEQQRTKERQRSSSSFPRKQEIESSTLLDGNTPTYSKEEQKTDSSPPGVDPGPTRAVKVRLLAIAKGDDLCLAFALGAGTPWRHRSLIPEIVMLHSAPFPDHIPVPAIGPRPCIYR
ncbi:kinase-like domain-containing protein [Tanacetum coccineum]|uniref:Kinase-like domain-containing protein n=1 Tax=Tanacetum coccineum TaxID=301880 RepID=A0ABQ5HZ49_9ASTR